MLKDLSSSVKRIVFLGDSITQGGDYVTDIECYLLSHGYQFEIFSIGLSSESSTDLTATENAGHLSRHGFGHPFLSERLERTLSASKPDLLFSCYGMNDCGALPAGEEGLRRFQKAQEKIFEASKHFSIPNIVFCTPPVRDSFGDPEKFQASKNLEQYSEWLSQQSDRGWKVVEIFAPMKDYLSEKRLSDPKFKLAEDGVHPGREGHFLMAKCILEQYFEVPKLNQTQAEDFFNRNGAPLRQLVHERKTMLTEAWLTKIGHTRPKTPGGPDGVKGLELSAALLKAEEIKIKMTEMLSVV